MAKQAMPGQRQGSASTARRTTGEIPELAQIVKQSSGDRHQHEPGDRESTAIAAPSAGPPQGWTGNTPWPDAPINITDWGRPSHPERVTSSARSRPRRVERAPLLQTRSSTRWSRPTWVAELTDQNKAATAMQLILLHDNAGGLPVLPTTSSPPVEEPKELRSGRTRAGLLSKTSLG